MKIAILNAYQNKVSRGAETFVREIAKRLSRKNKIEVLSSEEYPAKNIPIVWRTFLDPKGLQILFFTIKKLPYLWRNRFDIVIPINGGWQPAIIRILTWLKGGKMIIVGHSGKGWDDRNNLWCFPDCFVALSTEALGWAKRVNPNVYVRYIPDGVDIDKFTSLGDKIDLKLGKPLVLSVAALTKSKRLDLVIKAASRLKNVSLLVVGQGELENKINKLGRRLLEKRFLLTSFNYEDMPKVYRTADVFASASEPYFSFEMVLLEAMATNLPVVANDDPIRHEIVGDSGILIDPENTNAYVKALDKALTTNWGNKPRLQAEKFSWEKISGLYEKLLYDVIDKK